MTFRRWFEHFWHRRGGRSQLTSQVFPVDWVNRAVVSSSPRVDLATIRGLNVSDELIQDAIYYDGIEADIRRRAEAEIMRMYAVPRTWITGETESSDLWISEQEASYLRERVYESNLNWHRLYMGQPAMPAPPDRHLIYERRNIGYRYGPLEFTLYVVPPDAESTFSAVSGDAPMISQPVDNSPMIGGSQAQFERCAICNASLYRVEHTGVVFLSQVRRCVCHACADRELHTEIRITDRIARMFGYENQAALRTEIRELHRAEVERLREVVSRINTRTREEWDD